MDLLSDQFAGISESQTVKLTGMLAKLRREGRDVVALGAGEPDFDTPEPIKEAAIQAIRDGFTKYTAAEGIADLRQAIADWLRREYGADYRLDQILVTGGAKFAVFMAIAAVCNPGDQVILPAPYWVSYPEQIKLVGARATILPGSAQNDLKITAGELKSALTDKTRLIILNSPGNPSGAVYSRRELDELVAVIADNNLFVLSDEIYDQIVYDGQAFTSLCHYPEIRERLLLVNGVSKTFAMTGWRIGFLAGPVQLIAGAKRYQGHTLSNPTSISQMAALQAYRGEKEFMRTMLQAFSERRDYVVERLSRIPGLNFTRPQGAFYVFPSFSALRGKKAGGTVIQSSMDLCNYLLAEHDVAVVPGSAFGMDHHFRLSFATSMAVLEKAFDRIERGIKAIV
ncbi:pyridoxal phosphate-dependent aminotransferase [candidate division KSB1 bacterium]|nr:pyridoxal phosphate-dependent aminotransferase [candidate division KSB1 bacterium]